MCWFFVNVVFGRLAALRPFPLEFALCWLFVSVVFGRLAVLRLPVLGAWLMLVLRELVLCRFFVSVVLAAVQYDDLLLVFGFLSCRFFVNLVLGALQYYESPLPWSLACVGSL